MAMDRWKIYTVWHQAMPLFLTAGLFVMSTPAFSAQEQIDWHKLRMTTKRRRTTTKKKLPKGYELTEKIVLTVTLKNDLTTELNGLELNVYTIVEQVHEDKKKIRQQLGPGKKTGNISIPGLNSILIEALSIELKLTREVHDRLIDHNIRKMPKERGVVCRGWIVILKDSSGRLIMAKGSTSAARELGQEFKILPKGLKFDSNGFPKPAK